MTDEKKTEPPLALAMSFDEALARFSATDPKEVLESIDRAKQKKPPPEKSERRARVKIKDDAAHGRKRKPK